jgi:hypothetical protein
MVSRHAEKSVTAAEEYDLRASVNPLGPDSMPMDSRQQLTNVGLAGLGGVCAQFATHPFETTMVRQQLAASLSEGGSLITMAARIVRTEGVPMLWRGFEAAAVREILYSSLRFGLYEPIKTLLRADAHHYGGDPRKVPFWKKFAAGCLAGSVGSALASPTDLLKTRMQRDMSMPPKSTGYFIRQIIAEPPGLPFNLYLGAGATIMRAAVLGGTKMAVYDQCKVVMKHTFGLSETRTWSEKILVVQLGASVLTGLAVTMTSSPFTNARTFIMSRPPGTYPTMLHCIGAIVAAKGPLGTRGARRSPRGCRTAAGAGMGGAGCRGRSAQPPLRSRAHSCANAPACTPCAPHLSDRLAVRLTQGCTLVLARSGRDSVRMRSFSSSPGRNCESCVASRPSELLFA